MGKIRNYTRNEWKRRETTLETSGQKVNRALQDKQKDNIKKVVLCFGFSIFYFQYFFNFENNNLRNEENKLHEVTTEIEGNLQSY